MILKKQHIIYLLLGTLIILLPFLIINKLNVDKTYKDYSVSEQRITALTKHDTINNGFKILKVDEKIDDHNGYHAKINVIALKSMRISPQDWYIDGAHSIINQGDIAINGNDTHFLKKGQNTITFTTNIPNSAIKKYTLVYVSHIKNQFTINRLT